MVRQKLEELRGVVESELVKAKSNADKTLQPAIEIAATSSTSGSQVGDRENSPGQAKITNERHQKLIELKEEIEKSLKLDIPEKIEPVCFVIIEWEDKEKNDFYLVSSHAAINGKLLVSIQSKLGSAILGKGRYEDFEVESDVNTPNNRGRILDIQ